MSCNYKARYTWFLSLLMSRGFSGTRLSDGIIGLFFFQCQIIQTQYVNTHKNQKKQVGLCYKVKNTDSMDKRGQNSKTARLHATLITAVHLGIRNSGVDSGDHFRRKFPSRNNVTLSPHDIR